MSEYSKFAINKLEALTQQIRQELNCFRVSLYCYKDSFEINIKKNFDFSNLETLQKISNEVINYFDIKDAKVKIHSTKEILIIKNDSITIEITT